MADGHPPGSAMRIFILTLGSRGDFEPFWSLAQALSARGHEVTLGSSAFHHQADPGLRWLTVGDSTQADLARALQAMAAEPDPTQRVRQYATQWLIPQLTAGDAAIAAEVERSDYVINNLKLTFQRSGRQVPGAFVSYEPPQDLADLQSWGSADHGGRTLELVALPHALVAPEIPPDAGLHFTGFWAPPRRALAACPMVLAAAPDAVGPVVLTMGSMAVLHARSLVDTFVQALLGADLSGIVVGGPALPATVRLQTASEVDYEPLFRRASCVVHHGGTGTVGAVLRAGVPSVLLLQIAPQHAWARVLLRAHLCAGVLDVATLTAPALAGALRRAVDDDSLRHSARHWQSALAGEAGLAHAVALIEAHGRRVGLVDGRALLATTALWQADLGLAGSIAAPPGTAIRW